MCPCWGTAFGFSSWALLYYTWTFLDKTIPKSLLSNLRSRKLSSFGVRMIYINGALNHICIWLVQQLPSLGDDRSVGRQPIQFLVAQSFVQAKSKTNLKAPRHWPLSLGRRALKTPTSETPGFGGHVTTLTFQYLWPRPPGVWLGGPGCKPGHSGWSQWSPTIKIASGLIPVMVRGIQWWPVNSLHKGPRTRKMFPFDDVTIITKLMYSYSYNITVSIQEMRWDRAAIMNRFGGDAHTQCEFGAVSIHDEFMAQNITMTEWIRYSREDLPDHVIDQYLNSMRQRARG